MIILVCGGRNFGDMQLLNRVLSDLMPIKLIVEGGAPGADTLARTWAASHKVHCATIPAMWNVHGNAAGPIRNTIMLLTKPSLVVAFPGGRGTANMVKQARDGGIPVLEVSETASS